MNTEITYYSAIGDRAINEDTVSVLESGNSLLAIVADGLGGQGGGDTASQCAVSLINGELQNVPVSSEALVQAIEKANQKVLTLQRPGTRMMTTVAAVWMQKHSAVLANVGDSRIYQIRDGKIIYQSIDHSVAQMAVYVGEISSEQIRGHRDRNKLVRALGSDQKVKTDYQTVTVKEGDYFLVCSDGFWEQITEIEMLEALKGSGSVTAWMEKMREMIREAGNSKMDNNSAVIIKAC